jgi:hypothetical protein
MPVEDVKRLGRSTQGVIVMRLRGDDERVSALAPVVESDDETNGDELSAELLAELPADLPAEPSSEA